MIMTIAVLSGFFVIILMNVAAMVGIVPSKYISPNDVRGMAVEHNKQLFTLSFEQQNELVGIFNRSIPIAKSMIEGRKTQLKNPPLIQKIIVYRFSGPDIVITPVAYVAKTSSVLGDEDELQSTNMVLSVNEWNPNGYLEEAAPDELAKILLTTYDP